MQAPVIGSRHEGCQHVFAVDGHHRSALDCRFIRRTGIAAPAGVRGDHRIPSLANWNSSQPSAAGCIPCTRNSVSGATRCQSQITTYLIRASGSLRGGARWRRSARSHKPGRQFLQVTLVIPWLAVEEQSTIFPKNIYFNNPGEQAQWVKKWVLQRCGFKASFDILFYPGTCLPECKSRHSPRLYSVYRESAELSHPIAVTLGDDACRNAVCCVQGDTTPYSFQSALLRATASSMRSLQRR